MLLRAELDPIAQVSYTELDGYLRNTLLRDADAVSMAHPLEIRPVLPDYELVGYTFALPAEYKVSGQRTKRVLVDALLDVLPPGVVAGKKVGFELPLGPVGPGAAEGPGEGTNGVTLGRRPVPRRFSSRLRAAVDGHRPTGHRMWSIVMLLAYVEIHRLRLAP